MRQLLWQILGGQIDNPRVNAALCKYLKRRHRYYYRTSILEGSEIEAAQKSIKECITLHPELETMALVPIDARGLVCDRVIQTSEEEQDEERLEDDKDTVPDIELRAMSLTEKAALVR